MKPSIISGASFSDNRGLLTYNNDFDASKIKRVYLIENSSIDIIRAWQGHQIEQRWFSVVQGAFIIQLIAVNDWDNPYKNAIKNTFIISATTLDVLHIPPGYVTSIQAVEEHSKLLVMSDYHLGEIDDEYKYPADYFTK